MKLKNILWSWDFASSLVLSLLTLFLLPTWIKIPFASGFYSVGITVLSIVFSLFFAALAIIMASTDNDFIMYLEERKQFTRLMGSFKYTLALLFVSLIYSIILMTCSDFVVKYHGDKSIQHQVFFVVFTFLFTYSLTATALSVKDTISFTQYRTKFLLRCKELKEKNN
jgi:hypothetical protein